MTGLPEGLKAYLRVPFVMIVWVMETYTLNRARLKTFMAQPRTAQVFKWAIGVTALIWLVVAMMASEQQGQRFTNAVKGFWSDAQSLSQERKALQEDKESAQ